MRARALWFVAVVIITFAAGAVLAWRAGLVAGRSTTAEAMTDAVPLDGRIFVRLHAKIANTAEPARSHSCEFTASIVNHSAHHLLAAHVVLGSRSIDLPEIAAGHITDMFVWSVAIPEESSTCAEKARWFQKIAHGVKTTTCAMTGVAEEHCRKLIRIVGDFDYPALQADDYEAAEAARAVADVLRATNIPVGTTLVIPPGSFFKLGFDPMDTQKSDAAKALAAAQHAFDPANPADAHRMELDADYASMDGPVTILAAHVDPDQAADWYKVSLWAAPDDGTPRYEVIAWVPRDDLDKAREKARTATRDGARLKPSVPEAASN